MLDSGTDRSTPAVPPSAHLGPRPVIVFAVLAFVLALRIVHLSSASQSPLSYQPGPDEDYYLRFGQAVAAGSGAQTPEFTFMDPGYGYLLGAIFKVFGVNLFAVYLLQALLDTATAYAILTIGRMLGRPRAGLCGALLYGGTSTAILFCATLLKETCVAGFITWWVVCALAAQRSDRKLAWLGFGVFCGIGIALRSTLSLLALCALVLPGIAGRSGRDWALKAALIGVGLAVSLAPWSLRNERALGTMSPLPQNGGIVLHQVYNADNPQSAIWIPAFVNYSQPSEIWRGYAAEAERRTGHSLSPLAVDRYWRGQALDFMRDHPGAVVQDVGRKSLVFLADTEVPNNRSAAEERLFSPLLRLLPPPAAWLLAFGVAGLIWFAQGDRRWLVIATPLVLSWATFALFWAEDRFRFHTEPVLALCSGLFIDAVALNVRNVRQSRLPVFAGVAVLIAAVSVYLGGRFPPPALRWDHVVWGYIKMGKLVDARELAERIAIEQPDNGPILEALGFLAAADRQYSAAAQYFGRAIAVRPRSYLAHYNLAKALLALGDRPKAAAEARAAMSLSPSADTQQLLSQIDAVP